MKITFCNMKVGNNKGLAELALSNQKKVKVYGGTMEEAVAKLKEIAKTGDPPPIKVKTVGQIMDDASRKDHLKSKVVGDKWARRSWERS